MDPSHNKYTFEKSKKYNVATIAMTYSTELNMSPDKL